MKGKIILGIDPGSRITGFGVIEQNGSTSHCLKYGTIQCKQTDISARLFFIQQNLQQLIETFNPDEFAIEQIFTMVNHQSALKLGQARGAILAAAGGFALPVFEYSARQVKSAIVGYGAATKQQMQLMIRSLLKLPEFPAQDAADALAIALCHVHTQQWRDRIPSC